MYETFVRWSSTNLGQWHYVLGYFIVLVSHNWPIIVALTATIWFSYRAYQQPSRLRVAWLLTALLFGLAYEYEKHVASELHQAIDFLFGVELAALNQPLHLLVGPVANTILLALWLIVLVQALRLSLIAIRTRRIASPFQANPYPPNSSAPLAQHQGEPSHE
ncbi:MAG: hypothetical protein AB4911_08285 [Oscillochloridaceae bacterium umkhey_bin13]